MMECWIIDNTTKYKIMTNLAWKKQSFLRPIFHYSKLDGIVKSRKTRKMSYLFQHLTKSSTYETLKQVQGDRSGLFTISSIFHYSISIVWSHLIISRNSLEARSFSRIVPYRSEWGIGLASSAPMAPGRQLSSGWSWEKNRLTKEKSSLPKG